MTGSETEPSRAKLFLTNILVYGLGGVLGKLVPFLMLPIVTRLMPGTDYFGLADLTNTLVQFAQAFAIMGMYDAMFRMFFEREDLDYKKQVCTTALIFVTGCSLAVAVGLLVFQDSISAIFFGGVEFSSLVVIAAISVFVGGNGAIIQAPTRMQNKKLTFIIMNLITAILAYGIAIPMLLTGQYLIALPVAAALASILSLVVFAFLNRKWFSFGLFDKGLLKEMLVIGVPLMPTFIFYWVFNSADRIMIVNLIGADASGVYAAAAKIGGMSQLIYTAFSQGWQYFAFSTMHDEDQVELNSKVYEYLGAVSFLATGILAVVAEPLFSVFYPEQYAHGAISSVYLFLAPLLLMLYQVSSNQLLVIKKTWPSLFLLSGGAISNIVLNLILIPIMGIEGASIATLSGYLITNVITLVVLTYMKLLKVSVRFFITVAVFTAFFLIWRIPLCGNLFGSALACLALIAVYVFIYRKEIRHAATRVAHLLAKSNG